MTAYLLGLYFKFNLLLAASFLLWLLTRHVARVFGFELNHTRQLGMARYLLLGVLFVVPMAALLEQLAPGALGLLASNLSSPWLAGEMLVTRNIDNGLAWQYWLGSMTLQLGTVILVALLAGFLVQLWRMRQQVQLLRQLITQATLWKQLAGVEILFSPTLGTPFSSKALGRKHIVLPYQLLQSPRNLRLAVKHELQHLRNGDLDWVLLLEALKLFCFWNPATWLWHNEFDCLQEFACDEVLVGRRSVSSKVYGTCLLEVASASHGAAQVASSNMVPLFSLFTNQHSQLKRRILMLDKIISTKNSLLKKLANGLVAGTGLLSVTLLVFAAEATRQPPGPEARADGRAEYIPIVTIPPGYPQEALNNKLEGWTLVNFTVDEEGNVVDPEVVDGCVARRQESCIEGSDVFTASSLAAVARFRFNPRVEDGAAVRTPGVRYVFRFQLD